MVTAPISSNSLSTFRTALEAHASGPFQGLIALRVVRPNLPGVSTQFGVDPDGVVRGPALQHVVRDRGELLPVHRAPVHGHIGTSGTVESKMAVSTLPMSALLLLSAPWPFTRREGFF